MIKQITNTQKVPANVPTLKRLLSMKSDNCSEVKIYIPKDDKGNSSLDKAWLCTVTSLIPKHSRGILSTMIKGGINRYKTISTRKKAAKNLKNA